MTSPKVALKFSKGLTNYEDAICLMEKRVEEIRAGVADELIWFVEHPPSIRQELHRKNLIYYHQSGSPYLMLDVVVSIHITVPDSVLYTSCLI